MKKTILLTLIVFAMACKKQAPPAPTFIPQNVNCNFSLYFTGAASGNVYGISYRPVSATNWTTISGLSGNGTLRVITTQGITCNPSGTAVGNWNFSIGDPNYGDTLLVRACLIFNGDTIYRKTGHGRVFFNNPPNCY